MKEVDGDNGSHSTGNPELPPDADLLDRVLLSENVQRARARVVRNHGCPGCDGISVEEFEADFALWWPTARDAILGGTYEPQALKRVDIPKANGGLRRLSIPTVRDRFVLQTIAQVLSPLWDPHFSENSFAYRPGRHAHHAICQAQEHLASGLQWAVQLDIQDFFDHVDHGRLISRIENSGAGLRLTALIQRFMRTHIACGGGSPIAPWEGTPQGSPLSPLLANIALDEFDKWAEERGWAFCRYADDIRLFAPTQGIAASMLEQCRDFLSERLALKLNPEKSRTRSLQELDFLGFAFRAGTNGRVLRTLAPSTITDFRAWVFAFLREARPDLESALRDMDPSVRGWRQYYGFAQTPEVIEGLLAFLREETRRWAWSVWATPEARHGELVARGVPSQLAAQAMAQGMGYGQAAERAMGIALSERMFRERGWGGGGCEPPGPGSNHTRSQDPRASMAPPYSRSRHRCATRPAPDARLTIHIIVQPGASVSIHGGGFRS